MRIFILGFMASGKSTIGKKLANNLNLPFIDLDKVFENNQATTIRLYMYKYGEDAFRKIEKEILEKVINENENAVISTGGGTPCFFNNMQLMNSRGITVYLEVDIPTLVNRLMHSKIDRPLVWGKTKADLTEYAKNLLEKRNEFYSQAKYKVNGKNLTVNNLVTLIKTEL
ncbi:MAG: hypothetical protein A2X13_08635 [Bacteroidetes bacterium GWC2_33_15]|nr:MAG: hypothetical protein A2X10_14530 [Bacteroidetes bacterium GWA2_33_15]OFX51320.1 MAG: hypothetical protein A2X13_08635 [Bacteroidetes bacterium GWC2_33_15]OFX65099.1 MAG: hypothetical protein A2X15_06800 [Bacteroidetes bacterium GWB2_32_14]OFX70696.1 MAG: hypothetical protein A2X14_11010 [Bacteroidetes bacterium GWD2_33_33]HAN18509.1 shikimate kinase [Bacteroidales bacterium]